MPEWPERPEEGPGFIPFTQEEPMKKIGHRKNLKLAFHRETLQALEAPQLLEGIGGRATLPRLGL